MNQHTFDTDNIRVVDWFDVPLGDRRSTHFFIFDDGGERAQRRFIKSPSIDLAVDFAKCFCRKCGYRLRFITAVRDEFDVNEFPTYVIASK